MSKQDQGQQGPLRYDESPSSTETANEKQDEQAEELHNEKIGVSTVTGTALSSSSPNSNGVDDDIDTDDETLSYSSGPPSLNYTLRTHGRERYIIIFFTLLFVESGILPLILFYSLQWGAHLSVTKNLAIITSLIGTVSGLKITQRTYQLWFRDGHESRRPIGSSRWGVDTFQCVYACMVLVFVFLTRDMVSRSVFVSLALFAFFVPLIIGSSLNPASPRTVAMALPCLMLTFCIPMLLTGLFDRRLRLPLRVSSLPANSPLPPLTYTIVEDIIAVDGGGGLVFRHAWAHRYQTSVVIRRLLRHTAVWWGATGIVIAAILLAAVWTAPENTAYGLGYGMPWLWAMVASAATIVYVHYKLIEEKDNWTTSGEGAVHRDVQLRVQLKGAEADREIERRAKWERRKKDRQARLSAMQGVDGVDAMDEAQREGVACRDYASSGKQSNGVTPPQSMPLPERSPTPEGRPHTPPLSPREESIASQTQ